MLLHDLLMRIRDPLLADDANGFEDQAISVCRHFQFRVAVDFEKFQDRLFNKKTQAVSDNRQFFAHKEALSRETALLYLYYNQCITPSQGPEYRQAALKFNVAAAKNGERSIHPAA